MTLTNAPLQITLFAGFALRFQGKPVPVFRGDRPISLLAYLLLHRDAAVSRAQLAYTLWPDSTDSQARTNLRNLLHTLRQSLPDAGAYLASGLHSIQWRPEAPYTLDVAEFEEDLAAAANAEDAGDRRRWLESAVSLYKGNLLPGSYDDWIIPIRESLQQAYAAALQQLADLLEDEGDYHAAVRAARRLIQLEPLDEAAYVRLMRLHAHNGDRLRVHRVYELCRTTLLRELQVEPARAVQEAYAHYVKLDASPSTQFAPPSNTAVKRLLPYHVSMDGYQTKNHPPNL